jgi:hypothetical protein
MNTSSIENSYRKLDLDNRYGLIMLKKQFFDRMDKLHSSEELNPEDLKELGKDILDGYMNDTLSNSKADRDSPEYHFQTVSIAIRQLHVSEFNNLFKANGYRLETYINVNEGYAGSMVKGFIDSSSEPFYQGHSGIPNNSSNEEEINSFFNGFTTTTGTDSGRTITGVKNVLTLPHTANDSGRSTPSDIPVPVREGSKVLDFQDDIMEAFDRQRKMSLATITHPSDEDNNNGRGSGSGFGGFSGGAGPSASGPSGPSQSSGGSSYRTDVGLLEKIYYNIYIIFSNILDFIDIIINNWFM